MERARRSSSDGFGISSSCREVGMPSEWTFSKIPPKHIFIDTQIIADAPDKYLWAGIGDTMSKH